MTTMIEELAMHPELIYRHTVDEYHQMCISNRFKSRVNSRGLKSWGVKIQLAFQRLSEH